MGQLYDNAYHIMSDVRHGINEFSTALLQGTDTSGKYTNDYLTGKINAAQRQIWSILLTYIPEHFLESESIACTNSVITLPAKFGKIVQLEDPNGYKIWPSTIKATPTTGQQGSDLLYYKKGRTLVLMKASVTQTCTLKYLRRPREIHAGKAAAGSGASALRMDTSFGKPLNDYYNDMTIEDVTQAFTSTISDYAATNFVATITGTAVADDYYGIVSELPEEFHFLIAPLAVIITKAQHPASQELPTRTEVEIWNEQLMDTVRTFGGEALDIDAESIWTDFANVGPGYGFNIPNQGYTVF